MKDNNYTIHSQSEATLRVAWGILEQHIPIDDLYENLGDPTKEDVLALAFCAGVMLMTDSILNVIRDREEGAK